MKHLLSVVNTEKRMNFSIAQVNKLAECWDNVIYYDATKIMMYYHNGTSKSSKRSPKSKTDSINFIRRTMEPAAYIPENLVDSMTCGLQN